MIFYSDTTLLGLIIASIPAIVSLYYYFILDKKSTGLLLLFSSGFFLRILLASIDPFLQDWDERFHALVAKNMMDNPFTPMLKVNPIMPYKVTDWCCNHIWVHKQPLFLWQMAISMKVFGVNVIAMRLPSVFMGTISIFFGYEITRMWLKNDKIAYLAGLLITFSYYQLELTSGRLGLEHNDLAFSFYVTASIYAFLKYLNSENKHKWVFLIGLFAGCAILIKWLTGLLIFGGWFVYLLLNKDIRTNATIWRHLVVSVLVSIIIFLPWQIYIIYKFPLESSIMYELNRRHIFEVLDGQSGSIWYHLNKLSILYGKIMLFILPLGFFSVFKLKNKTINLSVALLAMVLVIYAFFSLIVLTKMPSFPFPVFSIIWAIIALGVYSILDKIIEIFKLKSNLLYLVVYLFFGIYALNPKEIAGARLRNNETRNNKIDNSRIYESIDTEQLKDRIIINCKPFEDTELMFFQDVNAYHWFPEKQTLDSLIKTGFKFAAFKNHTNQILPEYITNNKDVIILDMNIK